MALNRELERAWQIYTTPTDGPNASVLAGDPVLVGQMPAVALIDATDTIANGGMATVQTNGAFNVSVAGKDNGGNVEVEVGDIVYYDTGDNVLNVDAANGVRFGYALAAVQGGATSTIEVKVGQ